MTQPLKNRLSGASSDAEGSLRFVDAYLELGKIATSTSYTTTDLQIELATDLEALDIRQRGVELRRGGALYVGVFNQLRVVSDYVTQKHRSDPEFGREHTLTEADLEAFTSRYLRILAELLAANRTVFRDVSASGDVTRLCLEQSDGSALVVRQRRVAH